MCAVTIRQVIMSDVAAKLDIHFNHRLGRVTFPQLYDWSGQQESGVSYKLVRWQAWESRSKKDEEETDPQVFDQETAPN